MGQAIAFDTYAYVKKLKAVGFTEEQAETLASTQAELIDERLATKHDIMLLKHDIKELEVVLKHDIAEVKRDIKEMESSLKRDMKEMESNLKRDVKELDNAHKSDMKEMELRMTIKLGAITTSGIIIVAALVKLL